MFISVDGIDGGGKSTQIQRLAEWLRSQGRDVLILRDPGSSKLGEAVREILLHREDVPLGSTSEMLLYMAARAQMVEERIVPALAIGTTVVCDRFLLANVVYQGWGGGLDPHEIWDVGHVATKGLEPDITFLLDLPVDVAMTRIGAVQDRLEKRGEEYYARVRAGFLQELGHASKQTFVIDASLDPDSVQHQLQTCLEPILAQKV